MKVRMDFVTNSSSSSYVIAFKQLSDDELNSMPKFAKRLVESFTNLVSNDLMPIRTKKDLEKYLLDFYGYETLEEMLEDDEWAKKRYDEWLEKIEQGFAVGEIDVEYGDETMPNFLHALADGETFIMLDED